MSLRGKTKKQAAVLSRKSTFGKGKGKAIGPRTIRRRKNGKQTEKNLATWLLKFAGLAKGLPPDMAKNHDHYIHGTPRR